MRRPDVRDSVRILAIGFLLVAGVNALVEAGHGPRAAVGLIHAAFLAVPLVYARMAGLRPLGDSGFSALGVRRTVLVLAASLASLWVLKVVSEVEVDLLKTFGITVDAEAEEFARRLEAARRGGRGAIVVILALLPALTEETFFRGIVLRGFASSFGPFRAVIYTTVLFAAAHGTLGQACMMLVTGLYFGVVVWLTGSLWAGVLAHAVNNLAVVGVVMFAGTRIDSIRAPSGLAALSLAVFVMALAGLALERKRGGGAVTPVRS